MKIALAQFNPTVGDFAGNTARILYLAAQAQQHGAGLAVFTELCLCGYPPQDLLERPAFIERNHSELKKLVTFSQRTDNMYSACTANSSESRFAKTCGTTRTSGRSNSTIAIR